MYHQGSLYTSMPDTILFIEVPAYSHDASVHLPKKVAYCKAISCFSSPLGDHFHDKHADTTNDLNLGMGALGRLFVGQE